MLDVSLWGAFIGGLVVFFSPCILPIVPFYLSYMAGSGLAALKANDNTPYDIRRRALISSISFSFGIISVFVLLGAAAFSISQTFRSYQDEFRWVAAAIILIMGLHFLGVIKIAFLDRQFQIQIGDTGKMNVLGSFVVGVAFAAGWTPCVGGVLTAVIMTASLETTAYRGLLLLFVFGVGLTMPFIIAAWFINPFLRFMAKFRAYLNYVEKLMGLLLIFFAGLLITDSINGLANWIEVGDDGLHKTRWMQDTFKDLREDLEEANAEGKRLVLFFEQIGCIYCTKMHKEVFSKENISDYIEDNFFVVQLNLHGDIEVTDFDGEILAEKDMARKWGILFTPSIIFLPQEVKEDATAQQAAVAMMPGAFHPGTTLDLFTWVREERYLLDNGEDFQRYHARMVNERRAARSD